MIFEKINKKLMSLFKLFVIVIQIYKMTHIVSS